ncbi:MAG: DUF1003 domain-containing protein [Acidimicrobiia bacterium]
MTRRDELSQPRRGLSVGLSYDSSAMGQLAENVARFLGTGRYLAIQTVVVIVWITLNVAVVALRWDPYPFILLNLAFSTQAAYAAPLILLAQNRQEERDRVQSERDRQLAARNQADTEYLARELAAIRLALADVVTIEDLERVVQRVRDDLLIEPEPKPDDE